MTNLEAYVYGLIFADGYIGIHKGNECRLSISQSDTPAKRVVMEYVSEVIGRDIKRYVRNATGKYYNPNRKPTIAVKTQRKVIIDKLSTIGFKCGLKKNERSFKNIPEKVMRDFLRGLWDADGTFGTNRSVNYSLTSGIIICSQVHIELKNRFPNIEMDIKNLKSCSRLYLRKKYSPGEVFNWLYQKGDPCNPDNYKKVLESFS